ncbi:MAG TPA: hypothetical protein VF345_09325 [Chthoniobacterales bacterium]
MKNRSSYRFCIVLVFAGLCCLFWLYTTGLSRNPPGFYVDESALAYNAYLVAHTGAGEFGPRFPIYFQFFADGWSQYVSPTQVYLLAILFRFLPPSILLARIFAAFWIFTACLLLGLLAWRVSGRRTIAIIVAATALVMPWFFEVSRLLLEPHFVPFTVVLFLLVLYRAREKEKWDWRIVVMLIVPLTLMTYCYQVARVLARLLAIGLLLIATSWQRLISVVKIGLLYGITLVPIVVFNWRHPGNLTKRLWEVSYIRPGIPLSDLASQFFKRYLEDQSLTVLLLSGDYHGRHHVPGSGGAIFVGTYILAVIGLFVVLACLRRDPWWRYILYGLAVSVVPGAIGVEPFHELHLIGYPVFLLVLTVPALEWFLAKRKWEQVPVLSGEVTKPSWERFRLFVGENLPPRSVRFGVLSLLLVFTMIQAYQFQIVFRRDGPKRLFEFDVQYKEAYDTAVKQPARPIYLEDGKWGPGYIHALWYATVEKRPRSQFVHLKQGVKPPAGVVVISSEEQCQHCETILRTGVYHVYKTL